MKKFIAIILGLFLVLGFAGCNSDGSDMKIDLDEFINNPTNLTITGTTLAWDEVDNASGYIVYANEEEVDKIKTNSFDFDSLSGDVLVFQVRTRAPRGMQDSALSVKLAYVENKTEEIAAVKLALAESDMELGDEFSVELVNKGMLSSDVEGLVNEMDDFDLSMKSVESFDDMIDALRGLVEEAGNIEALVSAFVKTELAGYLEDMVIELESAIDKWEGRLVDPYSYYTDIYIQSKIDEIQMQIDSYEDLIEHIEDDPDSIVLAITSTIEYFISVEEMISDDLVSLIDKVADADNPSDLTAAELVDIKEEIVYVLRETMPTEEEAVLVMELADLITSLSGTTINYDVTVVNYKGKMAAQALYSIEAFTNFLDTFDIDFFVEFINYASNEEMSTEMITAESAILFVKYFDEFYDDNQDLLDTINEVFSKEEQEALFEEYKDIFDDMEGQEVATTVMTNLNFQQLLNLQTIFDDSFGDVLDAFVESDGEIVRQLVIFSNYSRYNMTNDAIGETYDNVTRFSEAEDLTTYDVLAEVFYLLDAFLQSVDTDDIDEMTSFVLDSVFESIIAEFDLLIAEIDDLPFTETQVLAAKSAASVGLEATNEDLLKFLQNLVEYIVEEEVFQDYKLVLENVHAYFTSEYGTNYDDQYNSNFYLDEYDTNATLIFIAEVYDDFMTNKNRKNIDDILEVVFNTWREDELLDITSLSVTDVNSIETGLTAVLDLLSEQFTDLKDLDYTDLNQGDLDNIQAFQGDIIAALMAMYSGNIK